MTKWPAHIEERAKIFELCGRDSEPLKKPTRVHVIWEGDKYIELEPGTMLVAGVGQVTTDKGEDTWKS